MTIDDSLISHLEKLAKLKLSATERSELSTDLGKILQMVEKLHELDLDDVKPLAYLTEQKLVLRADEVKGHLSRKQALKNAPDHDGVFFKVPKVIDIK